MEIILFTQPIPQIPPISTIKISHSAAWNELKVMIDPFRHPSAELP